MAPRPKVDLDKLRMFAAVARRGTLSAAAKALGVPTSSVSRAMDSLERELGAPLLLRSPRSTRLTPGGERYHADVRDALLALDRAAERLREEESALSGVIRFTAPPVMVEGLLTPLMARFRRDHPGVTFDVIATTGVVDLGEPRLDFALRMRRVTGANVRARRVGKTTPRLFASPSYLTSRGAPETPADLRDHDGVVFSNGSGTGLPRLVGPDGAEHDMFLRVVIACNDHAVIRRAVMDGCGIGIVPSFYAERDVAHGRLTPVLPRFEVAGEPVWLVTPEPGPPSERVKRFLEVLVETMSGDPDAG